jgi:DNA-binding NarL/FixJ family response regulator
MARERGDDAGERPGAMLAGGRSTAAIAAQLGVAAKTVTNNLSTIFAKLGVAGRTEAALLARDHGLGHGDRR